MSEKQDAEPQLRLIKKRDILKVLNVSRSTFERKLEEGTFPKPYVWLSSSPQGRRWNAEDIRQVFGIEVPAE